VQTILWGQPADKAEVLPDSCEGGALHGSEVYLIGVDIRSGPALEGFLLIKKKFVIDCTHDIQKHNVNHENANSK